MCKCLSFMARLSWVTFSLIHEAWECVLNTEIITNQIWFPSASNLFKSCQAGKMPFFSEEARFSVLSKALSVGWCLSGYLKPCIFFQWSPHCSALISSIQIWVCTGGTWRLPCLLSLLIWDLEVWGISPSWEAGLAAEMEPPSKQIMHTLLFLLSFSCARSCGVDWGLRAPLTFVPDVKQSLDKFFGHVGADSVAHWKGKR